ncbi:Protein of unknown function (DUF3050) [Lacinutrix venerupis]|uniref:DUF3050 domain-containing protein n=1 Tax=Lacinutrix venerupis TaxID=1486034 RepID=UPI000EB09159|nr:DUF3050 domain-containing protein [Lacinutrix venerupis]RLJ65657.1 Protein of unknown function (DUF3050) [Lacinutrix venerupis]
MRIENVKNQLSRLREQLINHKLYNTIESTEDLSVFLKSHVFAVWDFMSLLKALQQKLTCTTTPWMPTGNPETRYLINEIVLAEETDITLKGERKSHFEMYLDAMKESNTSTKDIDTFLLDVIESKNVIIAIKNSNLNTALKAFLNFTFKTINQKEAHEIAAAFTFGREELIPNMFTEILNKLQANFPETKLNELIYYFKRHIELDEDEHGPMAMKMIEELCGEDSKKWEEVIATAKEALTVRINLWNSIETEIASTKVTA